MLDTQDPIDKNAHRWAELMRMCGLRGHVFAEEQDERQVETSLPPSATVRPRDVGELHDPIP